MRDILVSLVLFDYPIKGFLGQKLDELCKYIRSGVYTALRLCLGQYTKSNVNVGRIDVFTFGWYSKVNLSS